MNFSLKPGFCIISNFWDIKYIKRTYYHENPKAIVKVCSSSQMNSIFRPKNLIITSWISSPWIYSSRVKLHSLIQKLVTFSFCLKGRAGDILMPERGTEAELTHSLLLLYHLNVDTQAGSCNLLPSFSEWQDLKVGQFVCFVVRVCLLRFAKCLTRFSGKTKLPWLLYRYSIISFCCGLFRVPRKSGAKQSALLECEVLLNVLSAWSITL